MAYSGKLSGCVVCVAGGVKDFDRPIIKGGGVIFE